MSCRRCLCQFGSFVGNYLEEVGDWESVRREAMWTTTNSNFNMLTPLLQWQARKESCYAFVYYRYRFCLVSLLTLPEHLSSPPVFSGVRVTGSLVLYVCFIYRFLTFCTFSFGHCIVGSSSIYGLWLHLWYLQTLLKILILDFGTVSTVWCFCFSPSF